MPNKGRKLAFCKECKRKRFHTLIRIPGNNFRWTCSKGHIWIEEGITLHRIQAIMDDIFTPEKLKGLFDRDDIFFRELKRR